MGRSASTNRVSPTVTVDVSRAIDAHPDTEAIPAANVERLREVGRKTLYETLAALRAFRSR